MATQKRKKKWIDRGEPLELFDPDLQTKMLTRMRRFREDLADSSGDDAWRDADLEQMIESGFAECNTCDEAIEFADQQGITSESVSKEQ